MAIYEYDINHVFQYLDFIKNFLDSSFDFVKFVKLFLMV